MKALYLITLFLIMLSLMILPQEVLRDSTVQNAEQKNKREADDAALEEELAKELGLLGDSSATELKIPPLSQGSASRRSSAINPKISVVGTFMGSGTGGNAVVKSVDGGLSEAELSFNAYIDPYSKADFFVAFHNESENPFEGPDSEVVKAGGEYAAELEEAYITSLSLPWGLQLKAGKFRSNFGKINQIHPHGLNFLDTPRMYANFLGEEGLADKGIGINWLAPNPLEFFAEFTLEVTSGSPNSPSFAGGSNNLLYLGHIKSFFELNDNSTLELGLSGIYGPNDSKGRKSKIGSIDLSYKWKPLRRSTYKSLEWINEALISERNTPGGKITSRALFSFLRYQIAKRWFLGARYDYSEFPDNRGSNEKAYSGVFSFLATEFQKIELQFQHGLPAKGDSFNRVLLRAVFVIGAHGAHKY